jgi:hypothetical protein
MIIFRIMTKRYEVKANEISNKLYEALRMVGADGTRTGFRHNNGFDGIRHIPSVDRPGNGAGRAGIGARGRGICSPPVGRTCF